MLHVKLLRAPAGGFLALMIAGVLIQAFAARLAQPVSGSERLRPLPASPVFSPTLRHADHEFRFAPDVILLDPGEPCAGNRVLDGSFENPAAMAWMLASDSAEPVFCATGICGSGAENLAYAGAHWAAFTSTPGSASSFTLEQDVTIPLGVIVELQFHLRLLNFQTPFTFQVRVDDTIVYELPYIESSFFSEYRQISINLDGFGDGLPHTVAFDTVFEEREAGVSTVLLDEICLYSLTQNEAGLRIDYASGSPVCAPAITSLDAAFFEPGYNTGSLRVHVSQQEGVIDPQHDLVAHPVDITSSTIDFVLPHVDATPEEPAYRTLYASFEDSGAPPVRMRSNLLSVVYTGEDCVGGEGEAEDQVSQVALAMLLGAFNSNDLDGSGGLSLPEVRALLGAGFTQDQFNSLDANRDGELSEAELQARQQCPLPSIPLATAATDGSQSSQVVITWEEAPGAQFYIVYRARADAPDSRNVLATTVHPFFFDTSAEPFITSITSGPGCAAATGIPRQTDYIYTVRSVNLCGMSDFGRGDTGFRGSGLLDAAPGEFLQALPALLPTPSGSPRVIAMSLSAPSTIDESRVWGRISANGYTSEEVSWQATTALTGHVRHTLPDTVAGPVQMLIGAFTQSGEPVGAYTYTFQPAAQ